MNNYSYNTNKADGSIGNREYPPSLKQKPQWIVWLPEGKEKIPRAGPNGPDYPDQRVSATESINWLTHPSALEWVRDNPDYGMGFVLTYDDPFILIDIDDCRNPDTGELHPDARKLIDQAGTWTDVSVSGTGIHLLGRGEWGRDWHKANLGDGASIEVYDSKRFVAMSGRPLPHSPDRLTNIQDFINQISENFGPNDPSNSSEPPDGSQENSKETDTNPDIDRRLKIMFESKHGGKYRNLWEGHYREAGFSDRSEAEQSLVSVLSFFLGKNETAIRKAMNKACREFPGNRKWADRDGVYRDETVKTALETVKETYSPSRGKRPYSLLPDYSQQTFKQVDECLVKEGYGTTEEIADTTDRSKKQIRRVLSNLEDSGGVEWVRDGRNVYYYYVEAALPDRLSKKMIKFPAPPDGLVV